MRSTSFSALPFAVHVAWVILSLCAHFAPLLFLSACTFCRKAALLCFTSLSFCLFSCLFAFGRQGQGAYASFISCFHSFAFLHFLFFSAYALPLTLSLSFTFYKSSSFSYFYLCISTLFAHIVVCCFAVGHYLFHACIL